MQATHASSDERRQGTRNMIDKLLAERQQVLVMFCQVAGLEPYAGDQPVAEVLQEFCQILVDYSAFGHFEIYDRIDNGRERRIRVLKVAEEAYPRIAEASEAAVEFNDKYDPNDHNLSYENLGEDLSRLGEELAARIEMEDRVVAALLDR